MKTSIALLILGALSYVVNAQNGAEELYNSAIYQEEIVGNLDQAIVLYAQLVDQFPGERKMAANGLFHLGITHEKLGNPNAADYYQTILSQYSDQKEIVSQARNRLRYLTPRPGNGGLASNMMDINLKQVWENGSGFGCPSPDGNQFVFVNWDNGNMAIRDLRSGEEKDITTRGSWKTGQSRYGDWSVWSPKGNQIAFYWNEENGSFLNLYDLESGEIKTLMQSKYDDERRPLWATAWSPDGRYLAGLISLRKDPQNKDSRNHEDIVALYDLVDNKVIELKNLGEIHTRIMSFTSDGKNLIFSAGIPKPGNAEDIYMLSVEDKKLSTLIKHPANETRPMAIPGTNQIVFLSDRSGSQGLWKAELKGAGLNGEPRLVKQVGRDFGLIGFSQTGLLFYSEQIPDQNIFTVDIDFSNGKVISGPVKIPQMYEGLNLQPFYSPDGKYFAYFSRRAQVGEKNNVYVIKDIQSGKIVEVGSKVAQRLFGHDFWSPPAFVPGEKAIISRVRGAGVKINIESGLDEPLNLNGWRVYSKSGDKIFRTTNKRKSIVSVNSEDVSNSEKIVFNSKTEIYRLKLSPDGEKLAFLTGTGEIANEFYKLTQLKILDLKSKKAKIIAERKDGYMYKYRLAWSADGKQILTAIEKDKKSKFILQPVDGSDAYEVDLEFEESKFPSFIAVHPKGKTIAYSSGRARTDIWVMENLK